jgi:hypothetical protein
VSRSPRVVVIPEFKHRPLTVPAREFPAVQGFSQS